MFLKINNILLDKHIKITYNKSTKISIGKHGNTLEYHKQQKKKNGENTWKTL